MVGALFSMTGMVNENIGIVVTGAFLLAIILYIIFQSHKKAKDDGLLYGVFFLIVYVIEFSIPIALFFWLPNQLENLLGKYFPIKELARWIRWGEIFIAGILFIRSRKHAETRGLISFLGHYALFFFAWYIDRWSGIIIIALPLLFIYYYVMSRVALEIMPASNLDDKKEKYNRFNVFLSYTWGLQQPIWKTPSNTAQEAEKRIDGAPSFIKAPGMVWTHPHQVIGITEGPKFSVEGPGLIFLKKGKQPFDVVDLRDQSCKSTIKAMSRDGISFEAEVTASFHVDREIWSKEKHQNLRRANPILREGREIDRNSNGTFSYSHARVKSVLSYRSKKFTADGREEIERWNDHVLNIAEEAAREVLAERSIEDLWRAQENENSSAAEEIISEMKNLINENLPANGINLIHAKAFNFCFKEGSINEKEEDHITEQQLATWSVEWRRQQAITLENGLAESERIQNEARAYAHSILLTAIAEGLQQARLIHPNLPRYVIAMRFVGALEKMIEQQPETVDKLEARATLGNVKAHFLTRPSGE